MNYFTSDLHLNSENIIKYCSRPFKNAEHMDNRLIGGINERCNSSDTLYHIGDFFMYNPKNEIKPIDFEDRINANVVHVLGNHDSNNKVKSPIIGLYLKLGKKVLAWAQHTPPWYGKRSYPDCDMFICGHVHEKWKFSEYKGKLVVNVGCDHWGYKPLSNSEIIPLISKYEKGELNGEIAISKNYK